MAKNGAKLQKSMELVPTESTSEKEVAVWRESGKPPVLMSELSEEQLYENVKKVHQWVDNHRDKVFKHYQAIQTLLEVEESLGRELKERGCDLMIPQYSVQA
jgi:hypothetical protein